MHIGTELSSYGLYICLYCGIVDGEINTRKHIWRNHRDKEINRVIEELDIFLQSVSTRFMYRYKLSVDTDDLLQYLRTSIFIVLRDHYNPNIGTPEHFAKASCNNFLKRFLQEYHYKSNSIQINKSYDGSLFCLDENVEMAKDYDDLEDMRIKSGRGPRRSSWILLDIRSTDRTSEIDIEGIKKEIYRSLTPAEKEIFDFITDESEKFTQKMIAMILGISQPMVSYRVKSIRKKAKSVLLDLKT